MIKNAANESALPLSAAEKLLQELSNKVSVPLLFKLVPERDKGVSQSNDNIFLPKIKNVDQQGTKLK